DVHIPAQVDEAGRLIIGQAWSLREWAASGIVQIHPDTGRLSVPEVLLPWLPYPQWLPRVLHQLSLHGVLLARLVEGNLRNLELQGINLSGANLRQFDLSGADLRKANLEGVDLWDARLTEAGLQDSVLAGARLAAITATNARFDRANLTSANFRGAALVRSSFRFANLRYADFRDAELLEADFEQADLSDTRGLQGVRRRAQSGSAPQSHDGADNSRVIELLRDSSRDPDVVDACHLPWWVVSDQPQQAYFVAATFPEPETPEQQARLEEFWRRLEATGNPVRRPERVTWLNADAVLHDGVPTNPLPEAPEISFRRNGNGEPVIDVNAMQEFYGAASLEQFAWGSRQHRGLTELRKAYAVGMTSLPVLLDRVVKAVAASSFPDRHELVIVRAKVHAVDVTKSLFRMRFGDRAAEFLAAFGDRTLRHAMNTDDRRSLLEFFTLYHPPRDTHLAVYGGLPVSHIQDVYTINLNVNATGEWISPALTRRTSEERREFFFPGIPGNAKRPADALQGVLPDLAIHTYANPAYVDSDSGPDSDIVGGGLAHSVGEGPTRSAEVSAELLSQVALGEDLLLDRLHPTPIWATPAQWQSVYMISWQPSADLFEHGLSAGAPGPEGADPDNLDLVDLGSFEPRRAYVVGSVDLTAVQATWLNYVLGGRAYGSGPRPLQPHVLVQEWGPPSLVEVVVPTGVDPVASWFAHHYGPEYLSYLAAFRAGRLALPPELPMLSPASQLAIPTGVKPAYVRAVHRVTTPEVVLQNAADRASALALMQFEVEVNPGFDAEAAGPFVAADRPGDFPASRESDAGTPSGDLSTLARGVVGSSADVGAAAAPDIEVAPEKLRVLSDRVYWETSYAGHRTAYLDVTDAMVTTLGLADFVAALTRLRAVHEIGGGADGKVVDPLEVTFYPSGSFVEWLSNQPDGAQLAREPIMQERWNADRDRADGETRPGGQAESVGEVPAGPRFDDGGYDPALDVNVLRGGLVRLLRELSLAVPPDLPDWLNADYVAYLMRVILGAGFADRESLADYLDGLPEVGGLVFALQPTDDVANVLLVDRGVNGLVYRSGETGLETNSEGDTFTLRDLAVVAGDRFHYIPARSAILRGLLAFGPGDRIGRIESAELSQVIVEGGDGQWSAAGGDGYAAGLPASWGLSIFDPRYRPVPTVRLPIDLLLPEQSVTWNPRGRRRRDGSVPSDVLTSHLSSITGHPIYMAADPSLPSSVASIRYVSELWSNADGLLMGPNVDLNSESLVNQDLSALNLSGANLSGADLSGSDLRESWLVEANFQNAILTGAKFQFAHLEGADFSGASLDSAEFGNSNVQWQAIHGAVFDPARLVTTFAWFLPAMRGVAVFGHQFEIVARLAMAQVADSVHSEGVLLWFNTTTAGSNERARLSVRINAVPGSDQLFIRSLRCHYLPVAGAAWSDLIPDNSRIDSLCYESADPAPLDRFRVRSNRGATWTPDLVAGLLGGEVIPPGLEKRVAVEALGSADVVVSVFDSRDVGAEDQDGPQGELAGLIALRTRGSLDMPRAAHVAQAWVSPTLAQAAGWEQIWDFACRAAIAAGMSMGFDHGDLARVSTVAWSDPAAGMRIRCDRGLAVSLDLVYRLLEARVLPPGIDADDVADSLRSADLVISVFDERSVNRQDPDGPRGELAGLIALRRRGSVNGQPSVHADQVWVSPTLTQGTGWQVIAKSAHRGAVAVGMDVEFDEDQLKSAVFRHAIELMVVPPAEDGMPRRVEITQARIDWFANHELTGRYLPGIRLSAFLGQELRLIGSAEVPAVLTYQGTFLVPGSDERIDLTGIQVTVSTESECRDPWRVGLAAQLGRLAQRQRVDDRDPLVLLPEDYAPVPGDLSAAEYLRQQNATEFMGHPLVFEELVNTDEDTSSAAESVGEVLAGPSFDGIMALYARVLTIARQLTGALMAVAEHDLEPEQRDEIMAAVSGLYTDFGVALTRSPAGGAPRTPLPGFARPADWIDLDARVADLERRFAAEIKVGAAVVASLYGPNTPEDLAIPLAAATFLHVLAAGGASLDEFASAYSWPQPTGDGTLVHLGLAQSGALLAAVAAAASAGSPAPTSSVLGYLLPSVRVRSDVEGERSARARQFVPTLPRAEVKPGDTIILYDDSNPRGGSLTAAVASVRAAYGDDINIVAAVFRRTGDH
ncbi:MAG: pentapeptide repeat-containing protein, partial [Nocardioides sp.]